MKKLTILAAFVLSSQAMALDSVMALKGRFDYVHTETGNTPGAKTSSGIFTTSFLRLQTDSKINESTDGRLTLDLQAGQGSADRDNGLAGFVEEAYIVKKHGDVSLLVGKQFVLTGGFENTYLVRDAYLYSAFNTAIDNFYLTGLNVGYSKEGQTLNLQVLQQQTSDQTPLTDKKVIGLAYTGEFMDKMIVPMLSYYKQGTNRPGNYNIFTTASLRLKMSQFLVEADYLMLEQEKLNATGDAELNTMIGHVRYTHENFQTFFKYIKEEGKKGFQGLVAGSTESERNAWELGLEFVPNKDEDMRYHVVYNNAESKKKTPAPTSKVEDQKIYAGIAFNYNLLK